VKRSGTDITPKQTNLKHFFASGRSQTQKATSEKCRILRTKIRPKVFRGGG
jgi:hypothetical protein